VNDENESHKDEKKRIRKKGIASKASEEYSLGQLEKAIKQKDNNHTILSN
jgi:hypothetical protein